MIEFGYETNNGASHTLKLEAVRVGRRWAVSKRSLDRWAADRDAVTMRSVRDSGSGRGWIQLYFTFGNWEERQSLKRLAAAGHLVHRRVHCRDSHVAHDTFFIVGHREGKRELTRLDATERCTCGRMGPDDV